MSVVLDNKGLGNCLGVELVIANVEEGNTEPYKTLEMEPVQTDGTKVTYKIQYQLNDSGVFRYSFRMYPKIQTCHIVKIWPTSVGFSL